MSVLAKQLFTQREYNLMSNAQKGFMYDKRLFNKLEKLGVLEQSAETGCIMRGWYGGWVKIHYIDNCRPFQVEGIDASFGHKYVDGCFNPYFVKC